MSPLPILTSLLLLAARVYEMRRRTSDKPGPIQAPLTLTAMIATGTLTVLIALTNYLAGGLHFEGTPYALGLGLALMAFALRAWAAQALGAYWSMQIELRKEQPLVKTGPYAYVRHPIYSAAILEALSAPIMCHSAWGLAAVLTLVLPAILVRLNLEEKAMKEHFGPAYNAYMRETASLIPYK